MMCWMNFWTTIYYSIYLFGVSDAGMNMIAFCSRHHDALMDVTLFCMCGAFGQVRNGVA
jgi:UDP-galactose transporter B1